jgi:cytochrome c-type biogenesis protein CcmH/NrfF
MTPISWIYTQRYEEIVLGKRPINWGNAILLGLIVLVLLGGGGLVITHEKWVKVSIGDTKSASGEYPADAWRCCNHQHLRPGAAKP